MAKKTLTPQYGISLAQDTDMRGGLIQNILDSIDQSKKDFYAKLAPSFGDKSSLSLADIAKNFIRKNADDKVLGNLIFHQSLKSDNYSDGVLGAGWKLYKDTFGNGVLDIDKINVRKELITQVLTYERINAIGGTLLLSSAWCTVFSSELTDSGTRIKIRFKPDGYNINLWAVNDNIKCQSGIDKFFMSYVTDVSTSVDSDGCHFIKVYYTPTPSSATNQYQMGNYIPQPGDVIVQHGHRGAGNESRKNIILLSVGDSSNAYPYIDQYKDVTGFTTNGKLITRISNDVYFGRADKKNYLWWNKEGNGELLLNGVLTQTSETDTGFPMLSYKGEWDNDTTYYKGDVVSYLGIAYVMIDDNPSYDDEPSGLITWQVLIEKGADSVSVFMNNQSPVLPATTTGVVSDYSNAWTQIRVFDSNELEYDGAGLTAGTYKVVNIIGTNITAGTITSGLSYFQMTGHSAFLDAQDTASIEFTVIGKTFEGNDFTRVITQSFTKAKAGATGATGATGASGTNARAVSVTTTRQAWEYNSDGNIIGTPSAMQATLTATERNTSGTVYVEFVVGGVSMQNTTSKVYTYTPESLISNMPKVILVNLREGSTGAPILASDTITMYGVKEGSDAYTVILSNEAHTVPASSDGTVTSYTGSGTKITVFKGTTKLNGTVSGAPSTGQFAVDASVSTGTITIGSKTLSGTDISFGDFSSMTTDLAIINYIVYIEGDATQVEKTQSISKSKAGVTGEVGKTVRFTNWKAGAEYFSGDINDHATGYNPSKFVDYVTFKGSDGVVRAYKCIEYHIASEGNKPPSSTFWSQINYNAALATDVLLANTAVVGGFLFSPAMDEYGDAIPASSQYMRTTDSATNPAIRLNGDGSGWFAKKSIKWDNAGQLDVTGRITANAGKIGFMDIFSGAISSGNVKLSNESIEALSALKSPTTIPFGSQASWTDTDYPIATAYSQSIVVSHDFLLKFKVDTSYTGSVTDSEWEILIEDENAQQIVWSLNGTGFLSNHEVIDYFPAGSYKIYVTSLVYSETSATTTATIKGFDSPSTIYAYGQKAENKIGNNGLYSYWDDNNYLYYSSSYGFEMRFGIHGLKLSSSGLQKMSDGVNWSAI